MTRFLAPLVGAFLLAGCGEQSITDHMRRSDNIEDVRNVIYGDEVRVRLYRGMGGRLTDHATAGFGYAANAKCGVRFYVESGQQTDRAALAPNSAVRKAKLAIFVGTSLGGYKAREHAAALAPQHVRLLLVDTVPWTRPIPTNVGKDHVVWRNTAPFQLGGGRPVGTINDRPDVATHGWMIHRPQTKREVVEEICRGITHPRDRVSRAGKSSVTAR